MNILKKVFNLDGRDFLIALFAVVVFLAFVPIFTYLYFASDLQAPENIMNRNDTGLILYDRNNKPFFTFYSAHQKNVVPIAQISKLTQEAVISGEDKDFYRHPGFSPKAIIGAMLADFKNKGFAYGGSTITQQLVKNSLLNSRKDFLRKYQELILAQELERRYTKDQILEMYLNSVYFGEGSFGIEAAAENYFNKKASDLDLAQSTILASVLPAPTELSPVSGDLQKAKDRQKYILSKMVEQGYVGQTQADQAYNEQLTFSHPDDNLNKTAPHFALMVRDALIAQYGEEDVARSGFRVKTTLDLDKQQFAEKTVAEQVANLQGNNVSNGAAVVMDPKNGEVLALVGSKDWYDNQFGKVNMAITPRQPGSSFKPIVYARGFEDNVITPATQLKDMPVSFPEDNNYSSYSYLHGQNLYKPKDYDGRFRGMVLARRALANSLNIPAVEVLSKVGIPNAVDMAKKLGISNMQDPENYGLSLVLGAQEVKLLELTNAYAAFANYGMQFQPTTILQINDKNGSTVYSYNPQGQQVLDSSVAFLISSILSDNQTRAEEFGNLLSISRAAAVKTGTTEDYRDALTLGYTPSLVVGVWVGNNDNKQMSQVAGSLGAAPIWKSLMEHYLAGTPVEAFKKPDEVVALKICKYNGLVFGSVPKNESAFSLVKPVLAEDQSPSPSPAASPSSSPNPYSYGVMTEYFIKGTEPNKFCSAPSTNPASPQPSSQAQPPSPPPSPNPPPSDNNIQINIPNNSSNPKPQGGPNNVQIINNSGGTEIIIHSEKHQNSKKKD